MTTQDIRALCAESYGWLSEVDPSSMAPEEYISRLRAGYDDMAGTFAPEVKREPGKLGGVPGVWLTPPDATDVVVLYLHGGGLSSGSSVSHGSMVAQIALRSRASCFVADYRLAPENVFPAQLDDAMAAYQALLDDGVSADRIVIAGDSSGAGLTLSTGLAVRDRGIPLPAGFVSISAQADWTASSTSFVERAALDPIVNRDIALGMAATVCPNASDRTDPYASAVFGEYDGFPPILLQVGTSETLYDESAKIAAAARSAGVDVEFHEYPDMVHVFHLFWERLPLAGQAFDEIGRFVSRCTAR